MTDALPEIMCKCTKCDELQSLSEFTKHSNSQTARQRQCRTCRNAARRAYDPSKAKVRYAPHVRQAQRKDYYDPSKSEFRQSPHIDQPDMGLRYHLCDPVSGELVATAATREEARGIAINYHQRRRVRIKFVEIYDEETQEIYHLTRPTPRHREGVMRGPCAPSLPDEQLRVTRGPDKVPRGPRITVSKTTTIGGK